MSFLWKFLATCRAAQFTGSVRQAFHKTEPRLAADVLEDRLLLSSVQVIAAGTTGQEWIKFEVDGRTIRNFSNLGSGAETRQFVTNNFTTGNTITPDRVSIRFVNDRFDAANNVDRNVRVDAIVIDGVRYESEDASVYSTGTWKAEDGVAPGFRRSEYLHANGSLQFAGANNGLTRVVVRALGSESGESFRLKIDGQTIAQRTVDRQFRNFEFFVERARIEQLEIEFTNDVFVAGQRDRNLRIDYVEIDDTRFETESNSVFSTGTWKPADGVTAGVRNSEWLHSNGSFFFGHGGSGMGGDSVVARLNSILPDGWNSSLFHSGNDIRIQTVDTSGNGVVEGKFGSAGVISQLQDSRNGRDILAPSYQGETTDRVVQWTLWERGGRVVHDVPSLAGPEDSLNITQAGNFDGVLAGTVDVDLSSRQLDVWSVADQQWKPELQPHIQGTISSLTRTTLLDGGAILVRRIIRVDDITLGGQPTTISSAYFEAWHPFADATFNTVARSIDAAGNPNFWFADGENVPNYHGPPVDQTRGWATVFDRNNLRGGTAVSVVFGRDEGTVHLSDGQQVDPQRYLMNLLDFEGGLAVLPGLWTGELPGGSIIDQSVVILPATGVNSGTAATLDALAREIPPPQVYHPGALLTEELAAIGRRLEILDQEPRSGTNQLGTLV